MPGDPPGQPPDDMALPGIDRHILAADLPSVVPGDPDQIIGEILIRSGDQVIAVLQGRLVSQVIQGDLEHLRHLIRVEAQVTQRVPLHQSEHGMEDKIGPVSNKVQPPQQADFLLWDPKLLPGLPQGALLRRLRALQPPSGEAYLPRLAAQASRPHLIQEGQAALPLHQRDQHAVLARGVHQTRRPLQQAPLQLLQLHDHTIRLTSSRESCSRTAKHSATK